MVSPLIDKSSPCYRGFSFGTFCRLLLAIGLFFITIFTMLWAGAYASSANRFQGPWQFLISSPRVLLKGVPYAGTLLFILVIQRLGTYVLARINRVRTSLPLFIPGPPALTGSFGVLCRMDRSVLSRKAMFDVSVAGPIAGFLAALVALVVGLEHSEVIESRRQDIDIHLGEPIVLQFVVWLLKGSIPSGYIIELNSIALAGWLGLFLTSLYLMPIGFADGGGIGYAVWGHRQRIMSMTTMSALIVLGFIAWPGWFLWAIMGEGFGRTHPPLKDPDMDLGTTRLAIGLVVVAIFVLTFTPVPFSLG